MPQEAHQSIEDNNFYLKISYKIYPYIAKQMISKFFNIYINALEVVNTRYRLLNVQLNPTLN